MALVSMAGRIQHVLFRPRAVSMDVEFAVPPRYYVSPENDGSISLWQFGFGVPFLNGSYGFISLYPHTGSRPLDLGSDLERFRSAELAQAHSAGLVFREERMLVTRAGTAVCLAFSAGSRAKVACSLFKGPNVAVRFDGDTGRLADVYALVSSGHPI